MSVPKRKGLDFDYRELHRTGKRVIKIRNKMDNLNSKLDVLSINICSDIEDHYDSYQIENLSDEEELNEYVTKLGGLKKEFRRIHAQIKTAEGENFDTNYPNFKEQLEELNTKFKNANGKLTKLRKTKRKNLGENSRVGLETDKLRQEIASIQKLEEEKKLKSKSEWSIFIDQINWMINDCKWTDLHDLEEVQSQLLTFESKLEIFSKVCSDIESVYGQEASDLGYIDKNIKVIHLIRGHISEGKLRITDIKHENQEILNNKLKKEEHDKVIAEEEHFKQAKFEEKIKIDNLLSCAQNLEFEIKLRYDSLKVKCTSDLSKLSDYEILDFKKRSDNINSELRELLDKISVFIQFILPCGVRGNQMFQNVVSIRESTSNETKMFLKLLQKTIEDRDISEKKLKNASVLNIQLKKFEGYKSETNIYSFRSDFKKLIEPHVQKTIQADVLKKNHLAGAAYNLVSGMDDINKIWEKLIDVYGDHQLLLQNKIDSLEKFGNLDKLKDDEKIAYTLSSILNVMTDLEILAQEYDLEGELYHGGGLQNLLHLIGQHRERKFIKSIAKDKLKNKNKWSKLQKFLSAELTEREAYILNEKAKKCLNITKAKEGKNNDIEKFDESKTIESNKSFLSNEYNNEDCPCFICGNSKDHVKSFDANSKPFIEYVACRTFAEMKTSERNKLLYKNKFCAKCLTPGVKYNSEHVCDQKYVCNQIYKNKNGKEIKCHNHVLVCPYHADNVKNKELLDLYKTNMDNFNKNFKEFSKNISTSCFSEVYKNDNQKPQHEDNSIFAFQTIDVEGLQFNIFYDSGCGDLVISKDCRNRLTSIGRAKLEHDGPITLNGVGNQTSVCDLGVFSIQIPLNGGVDARMCGICVETITTPFPKYPLEKVEKDFRLSVERINRDLVSTLPKLPKEVGGVVDIMIGKQYLKYFPKEVVQLESGLTLYQSRFNSPDGTNGVIAGPHPEFTKIDRMAHFAVNQKFTYYSSSVQNYKTFHTLIDDVPLLGYNKIFDKTPSASVPGEFFENTKYQCHFGISCVLPKIGGVGVKCDHSIHISRGPKKLKTFEKIENTCTDMSYRCPECRNCVKCKNGGSIENISIQEEIEQNLINESITLDIENKVCIAKLPFIANPKLRIVPNFETAQKVYIAQIKKLVKAPEDKKEIIEAESKLQQLRYVKYLKDLPENEKNFIMNSEVKYFIPWRLAWSKSISSPVRPVFDASQRTPGGCSLNDILAKGTNNMNNLVEILIRWTIMVWAFHTDIRKMYNAVQLCKSDWCYQLYLWNKNLDINEEPEIKIITSVVNGIVSSGNQAERAIRLTAETFKAQFPKAFDIIHKDTYVDDVISGAASEIEGILITDDLQLCLEKGGFTLKGFSFSGRDPDENLSTDNKSVKVGGLKWFTKEDFLMFNVGELNFSKKVRGRKTGNKVGIPEILTKRDCVGKVAELYDPLGKITPLIAGMKLDISNLHRSGLSWDDKLPDNLRSIWESNFQMMQEIGQIKYRRAIVPMDAKNLDITTIDTGDASAQLICIAIHAQFELKDGTFSCQLVFGRSKVVPEGTSIPRAELMAARMNAATGFTVKKAFGKYHKKSIKLSDSMVALHWISNQRKILKIWVRNHVIEINRLVDLSCWGYVESKNMISDLGTRKGATINDVVEGSDWYNGLDWMKEAENTFPIISIKKLKLSKSDDIEATKEKYVLNESFNSWLSFFQEKVIEEEISPRYKFSKYLIDPNRYRFRKVIRVMALDRCPNAPLTICLDHKRIIESNSNIFKVWLKSWLVSFVPSLIERPKWHTTKNQINVGDVVLFLKSKRGI